MSPDALIIRPMTPDDLVFALDLAAGEGWNPGLHDAPCFYAADPGGLLVGQLDGRRIGCISATRYGDGFGFMGFFIVAPEYRKCGFGTRLWEAGMALLGDRVIGLDGVLAQEERYGRSGFRTAYSTIRFAGRAAPARSPGYPAHDPKAAGPGRASATGARDIRPLTGIAREELLAYDRVCFPAERPAFLSCWTAMPGSTALCALADGALCGYGVIRACRSGHKIGPLFAEDADAAAALYLALCAAAPAGEAVYLDVPVPNSSGLALAEDCGLSEVFRTVRMYRGPEPAVALDKVFGVTTFELG